MSKYCRCDASTRLRNCCRALAANVREIERLLEVSQPRADVAHLEESARVLAVRGLKVTMQNLVASGVSASIFQDVMVKKHLLDLKYRYNSQARVSQPQAEANLLTDDSGYLLSGFEVANFEST